MIEKFSEISLKNDGVFRSGYSEEEDLAIRFVSNLLPKEFEIKTDNIGNLIAIYDQDPLTPKVLIGIHLDTMPFSGKYSSSIPMVVAIKSISKLFEEDFHPKKPIGLIIFRGTLPIRFSRGCIGSRGAVGELSEKDLYISDKDGVLLQDEIIKRSLGLSSSFPTFFKDDIHTFLELESDFSGILEEKDLAICTVKNQQGPVILKLSIIGGVQYTCCTPFNLIKGPLKAFTRILDFIHKTLKENNLFGGLYDINMEPKVMGVFPTRINFTIDLRSPDLKLRSELLNRVKFEINRISETENCQIDILSQNSSSPHIFSDSFIDISNKIFLKHNIKPLTIDTGILSNARWMSLVSQQTGMMLLKHKRGDSLKKEGMDENDIILSIEIVSEILKELVCL
jgi:acetylornithine deacetylase/succinyl-diaminopimelate desuccinylase-like protein